MGLKRTYSRVLLSAIFLLFVKEILAQDVFRDFQVWQNFEIEYNLDKRWLGNLQVQTRLSENSTRFAYYYIDLGGMYKVTKNFRVNLDYIFVQKKRLEGTYSSRHQYNFYLNFRKKVRRFTFYDRILTEGQLVDFQKSYDGDHFQDFYLRNKASMRYMLTKRISPYISDEIYYKFDGKIYERGFDRNRVAVGFLYKLTQFWLLEGFYMFETNFNVKVPYQNFVVGVGLSRSFYQ